MIIIYSFVCLVIQSSKHSIDISLPLGLGMYSVELVDNHAQFVTCRLGVDSVNSTLYIPHPRVTYVQSHLSNLT